MDRKPYPSSYEKLFGKGFNGVVSHPIKIRYVETLLKSDTLNLTVGEERFSELIEINSVIPEEIDNIDGVSDLQMKVEGLTRNSMITDCRTALLACRGEYDSYTKSPKPTTIDVPQLTLTSKRVFYDRETDEGLVRVSWEPVSDKKLPKFYDPIMVTKVIKTQLYTKSYDFFKEEPVEDVKYKVRAYLTLTSTYGKLGLIVYNNKKNIADAFYVRGLFEFNDQNDSKNIKGNFEINLFEDDENKVAKTTLFPNYIKPQEIFDFCDKQKYITHNTSLSK